MNAPQPTRSPPASAETLFAGPGEMAGLCRRLDWAGTPLGPVDDWSQSLRTMAAAVLASRNPMLLFWGPELIQFYNDAFRPSLGPSTGPAPRHPRALGMRANEFWTDVWDVVGPQIEGVMERGESVWFEDLHLPIERGDGVPDDAWWTYSYSPVRDDDGTINGTLVVCLETTATVRAREEIEFERGRLTDLFRLAPAFMCVVRGPDHVFELTNQNYQKLIGFRDVVGRPVSEALPEMVDQGFVYLLDTVLETGEPFVGEGVAVTLQDTPDGPPVERRLNFVYQAITESDGSRSGVFVHGVDVTDTIRAQAEAEAANRTKAEFLAVMSHELRTPLNAIGGYAQILEMGVHGDLNEVQLEHVRRIRRSEELLLGLLDDVLNYARIDAGSVTYDLTDVAIADVIRACETLTAPQREAGELAYSCDGDHPELAVRADRDRTRQILLNVLTNAIKFTEPGGRIAVACSADEREVRVAVTDTGRGMDPDELDRIFDPFVQVGNATHPAGRGVGLGLAISRDLARGMGGDLVVTSEQGTGSTFTLSLPRSE